jgi:hypothetical protein
MMEEDSSTTTATTSDNSEFRWNQVILIASISMKLETIVLLNTNQSLKEVYVGYNMIPDEYGVRILANSLSNNKNIRVLDDSANDFGGKVLPCLLQPLVRSAFYLLQSRVPKSCSELSARRWLPPDSGVCSGCFNTTIKSLTLAETRLKSRAVCAALDAALTENTTLERLDLSDNRQRMYFRGGSLESQYILEDFESVCQPYRGYRGSCNGPPCTRRKRDS